MQNEQTRENLDHFGGFLLGEDASRAARMFGIESEGVTGAIVIQRSEDEDPRSIFWTVYLTDSPNPEQLNTVYRLQGENLLVSMKTTREEAASLPKIFPYCRYLTGKKQETMAVDGDFLSLTKTQTEEVMSKLEPFKILVSRQPASPTVHIYQTRNGDGTIDRVEVAGMGVWHYGGGTRNRPILWDAVRDVIAPGIRLQESARSIDILSLGNQDQYRKIPSVTVENLHNYLNEGTPPGGFLRNVLSNDLFGAVATADSENRRSIADTVNLIWNHFPAEAHGDPAQVDYWIDLNGLAGRAEILDEEEADNSFSPH